MAEINMLSMSPAERLEHRQREIIREYRYRLKECQSPLEHDTDAWLHLKRHAGDMLGVCIATLRDGRIVDDDMRSDPYELMEAGRVFRHLHPTEVLRASSLLVEVATDAISRAVEGYTNAVPLFSLAVQALNRSAQRRAEAMATGYDAFLYRRFKEGHAGERRRLAREIHDHVSNNLSAVLRNLELYEVYAGCDPVIARDRFGQARSLLLEALAGMHTTISDLRLLNPADGLASGLRSFLQAIDETEKVDIRLTGNECWLSLDYREQVFVIVREALRNALTHGGDTKVTVRIDVTPYRVRVVIEDRGTGFDVEAAERSGRIHGIASMRERAELLDGSLALASRVGLGTVIEVQIPLPECECDREA